MKKKKGKSKPKNKLKKQTLVRTNKVSLPRSKAGVTPTGDRVLVKPLSPEEAGQVTSFGIIIPDTAKEKPEQGLVIAVGPGKKNDHGSIVPISIKVGARVVFSKYGYDEVKVGSVEYYLVREENILAVIG